MPFPLSTRWRACTAISAGDDHSLGLTSDREVVAWGANTYGQCTVPSGLSNVVAIAAGGAHSLALQADGTVSAWGPGSWNNLDPYFGQGEVPRGLSNVVAIAAGWRHSLAIKHDGTVVAWGAGSPGTSGGPHHGQSTVPTGLSNVIAIAAGGVHSLALKADGKVVAWGEVLSQAGGLTVVEGPPLITPGPTNQSVRLGNPVVLHVEVTGSGPLRHQWRINGADIPGANHPTLTIPQAQWQDAGVYTLAIANAFGAITSAPISVFLLFDYAFSAPDGPLLWDLGQDAAGKTTDGKVTGNGSTVQVRSSTRYGYWEVSYFPVGGIWLKGRCTSTLTLDPIHRVLAGVKRCTEKRTEILLWQRRSKGSSHFKETVSIPLSEGTDGHWRLTLRILPDGDTLAGTASITLSGGRVFQMKLTGAYSPLTGKAQITLNGTGVDQGASLGMSGLGRELILQSLHGKAGGQSIDFHVTCPLSLTMVGAGQVVAFTNGQRLELGERFTARATPASGNLFDHWVVDGEVVQGWELTFTMSSNLTLVANFVPNPFIGLQGNYNGLFYDTNAPAHENAGFFTLTVTDKGTFSAKLQQGAAQYSSSGLFDLALSAQKTIPRPGTNEVVVSLQLTGGSDRVLGTVSNAAWSSELFGYRAIFNSKSDPATKFAGNYTMLLPGTADSAEGPMGHGFAQFSVDTGGSVSFKGTLGDGSAAVQKVPLATNGQWPFYANLYSGNGSVFSWLTLNNTPTNDVTGLVLWTKPGGVKGALHPGGFTNVLETLGSRYVAPASGTRVLALTNTVMVLEGGNLSAPLTSGVVLSDLNKVTVDMPNPQKLSLTPTPGSGSFKGSFIHPQTGKSTTLNGVLLQKQNLGAGFFPGTNQSGRVFFGGIGSD